MERLSLFFWGLAVWWISESGFRMDKMVHKEWKKLEIIGFTNSHFRQWKVFFYFLCIKFFYLDLDPGSRQDPNSTKGRIRIRLIWIANTGVGRVCFRLFYLFYFHVRQCTGLLCRVLPCSFVTPLWLLKIGPGLIDSGSGSSILGYIPLRI